MIVDKALPNKAIVNLSDDLILVLEAKKDRNTSLHLSKKSLESKTF